MYLVELHPTQETLNQLKKYQFISTCTYLHIISDYISIAEIRPSSNYLLEHLRLYFFPNGESSADISESQEVFEIVTSAFVNKELLTVMFYFILKLSFNSLSFIDRIKIYMKQ